MKKLIISNIVLLVLMLSTLLYVLLADYVEPYLLVTFIIIWLVEAYVFLLTIKKLSIPSLIKIKKVLKYYLGIYITTILVIKLIELLLSWRLILGFNYSFILVAFLIYPLILWIYIYLMLKYSIDSVQKITLLLSFFVTACLMIVNGMFSVLTYQEVSLIEFEDNDHKLVLVEERILFSSNHKLYLRENLLFVSSIDVLGSWSCDDGCIVGDPDIYTWTWIDDNTLVLTGGGLLSPVTFYFEE